MNHHARRPHQVIDGVEHAWCGSCPGMRPVSEFFRRAASWDGLQPECKACRVAKRRDWCQRNLEAQRAYQRQRSRDIYRLAQGLPVDAVLERGPKPRRAAGGTP